MKMLCEPCPTSKSQLHAGTPVAVAGKYWLNINVSGLGIALDRHLPPPFCNHKVAKDLLLLHIPDSVPEQIQAGA